MSMGKRRAVNGYEEDATSGWCKRIMIWRAGERRAGKKSVIRRERREGKKDIRQQQLD